MLLDNEGGIAKVLRRFSSVDIERIHGVDDALQVAGADMGVDLSGFAGVVP